MNWRKLVFTITFIFTTSTQIASAKLLDKVLAVINDEVITLSLVKRISENLVARRNIAPQIYQKDEYTEKELVTLRIQRALVREKLKEIGFDVSDEQVEVQIKQTEQNLNLDRRALLEFLSASNMTFDEYFELIREAIEFKLWRQVRLDSQSNF